MSDNDMQFDRRSMLKTIGSAAVAGIGLSATSGTVAAVKEKRRLTRAYSDERRLRTAFEQHGDGLRQTLVDEGFVAEDFEFGALTFDIDPEVNGVTPTAEDSRAGVTGITEDGDITAFASVSTSSATHDISLFVQPERDKAHALIEPKDSSDRFIVTESSITPTGCAYSTCGSSCSSCYETKKYYECDPDCTNCELVDTGCDCPKSKSEC